MFLPKFLLISSFLLFIIQKTCAVPGGINEINENDTVKEIADWTTTQMVNFTGIPGTYTVNSIKNIQAQVVAGRLIKK